VGRDLVLLSWCRKKHCLRLSAQSQKA